MDITERLRELQGNKSLRDFAEEVDINQSTLHNYLRGRTPPANIVAHICRQLFVNPEWLLLGTGPKFSDEPGAAGPLNLDLMREVIETVEEKFQKEDLHLPPKKKAELITLLYEEIVQGEAKKAELGDKVVKLARFAS